MATLKKAISTIKAFNFELSLLKVVKDNDNVIIDLNTDDQLFKFGIDSAGQKLAPYRSSEYAQLKAQLNPNRVTDLKLEGDFYKGFRVDADKFPIYVTSIDDKAAKLVAKYGEDIFGLTQENKGEFSDQILQDVQQEIRQKLGIS